MTMKRIDSDHRRFQQIIHRQIKKELHKLISNKELIARKGEKTLKIPLPQIEIPHFTYGNNGGVGMGKDVKEGDQFSQNQEQQPGNKAGEKPGEHAYMADITLPELASILGEYLNLPNIKPKGQQLIVSEKTKYTNIRRSGPEGLKHFKKTYKEALKRQISTGTYNPENPIVIPIKDDKRYRSNDIKYLPESSACLIYVMDVSGSMDDGKKQLVQTTVFWIDAWLRSQYKNIVSLYLIHDSDAKEVTEKEFYTISTSGGTKISAAYELAQKLIEEKYKPEDYNIYLFHFSDGDNLSLEDTNLAASLIKALLEKINLFCYGQVDSEYGSVLKEYESAFRNIEKVVLANILTQDKILDSIKLFFHQGN